MKNLKIKDILRVTQGKLITGNDEDICITYSKDTRTIKKGDCYLGIKGEKWNGSDFWEEALKNGADTVIVSGINFTQDNKEKWKNKNIIVVEDVTDALQKIARAKRELYDIPVIAVTGSVGKTTTKDMIANVLSQKYKTFKTQENYNGMIGLPFTILQLKDEEVMVVEMGMNHFGEMSVLTSIAKPQICVITNIGTSHIGNLGSRENILKAKLEILEGTNNPTVIINNDNDLLHDWYLKNNGKYNIKTYGINEPSMINAKNIKLNENSSEFECEIGGKDEKINLNMGGEHLILNSLCAITIGELLNVEPNEIKKGIETFELTKRRMEIYHLKDNIRIINDAYNASFESTKAALAVLSNYTGRKIAVLGDMLELGKFSKELHEKVGKQVAKSNVDILIAYGENSKYIVQEAKKKMSPQNVYYLKDKEEIKVWLKKIVKPNDAVLFKASNGMGFYKIAEELKNE